MTPTGRPQHLVGADGAVEDLAGVDGSVEHDGLGGPGQVSVNGYPPPLN
jgi:hypothetical protein